MIATIGPMIAHVIEPDMALPPSTPTPCSVQRAPITTSTIPPMSRAIGPAIGLHPCNRTQPQNPLWTSI